METISHENIRQYRKFTAKFILGYWEIFKNIEIVNQQLRTKSEDYHKNNIPEEDAVCAICLNDYQENEKISILPCKHHFHQECVVTYLKGFNRFCPICRQDIAKGKDLATHANENTAIVDTV